MKTFTRCVLMIMMFVTLTNFSKAAMISDAGVASATEDTICANGTTSLLLTGYVGNIQWQSFDGTNWINETNPGSTTDNYFITLSATTSFRAVVTDPGFPADTSNVITIVIGVTSPVTTGDTRCGYGPVTLTASGGGGSFKWYDVPTGGYPLYSGSTFTTNVSSTTTYYAAAITNGGGSQNMPLPPMNTTTSLSSRGFFFTAPSNFTMTGLYVPDPINGPTQNIAVIRFNPAVPPPNYPTGTNNFTTLFLTQNDPATGVIPVNIPIFAGDIIGVLATRGTSDVNSYGAIPYSTTIDGQTVALERLGMQYQLSTFLPQAIWTEAFGYISRLEITYEVGCESGRTPAVATITAPPAISITANPPALCQGGSTALNVSSANAGYNYTWSPSTYLSGTTGTTVTATPPSNITYTVIADDGTCGAIDSILIASGPASVAGSAAISTDTICGGSSAYLSLTGYTGDIQWQSYNGTAWVNETGPGSTTDNYEVSPTSGTIYQAVVTSGGCDADTTITLNLAVLTIVDPVVVNDTICVPGVVNLSASGAGTLNWYTAPTGGSNINSGTTFNPNISTTTTYYVQASAGGVTNVGPPDLSIGNQTSLAGNNYGLQFDVTQPCTIERVFVSPGITTGIIIINLKDLGGAILNTATIPVTQFSGLVPVALGFTLSPGTYQLQLATGSVPLNYNTAGAIYPYTPAGSPLSIVGGLNPALNTGPAYYFFYNWEINEGCASNRIPVVGVVNFPTAPTIQLAGTVLTSSYPSNNQWYLNGFAIPGATAVTYDMALTGPGSYTVTVTIGGCSSTSAPILYTSLNEQMAAAGISVYPNPVKDVISVEFENANAGKVILSIYNSTGALILNTPINTSKSDINFDFPSGVYSVEIKTTEGIYVTKVVKL